MPDDGGGEVELIDEEPQPGKIELAARATIPWATWRRVTGKGFEGEGTMVVKRADSIISAILFRIGFGGKLLTVWL